MTSRGGHIQWYSLLGEGHLCWAHFTRYAVGELGVMLDSLQSKMFVRLLKSGRLPRRAFFLTHFDRSTQISSAVCNTGLARFSSLEGRRT